MLTLFSESINSNLANSLNILKENIDEIKNLSPLLKVYNIEKSNNLEESTDIINQILYYTQTYIINDYSSYVCPCCKRSGILSYHKLYERNIEFNFENYLISGKINIIVLECSNCKQIPSKQHYHALLPEFIFPYHSHSKEIILNSINDKLINKEKIADIEDKYKISYQLFYYWINIFYQYLMASSIILEIPNDNINIIKNIKADEISFLKKFYQKYLHPYFLFKKTCVPLAITP